MTDWRRIDIDAFDPESRLKTEDLLPPYTTQVTLAELQPKITQLRNLSTSGDISAAVQLAMQDPPYSADGATKAAYFQAVLDTLSQVRQADIANIVKQLSLDQEAVLVKYLYKGMSVPEGQRQGGILLAWFEKLTQASGIAPITHYLSDRRTV
ncbi:Arc15p KNAG_0L01600 [Huiozyma naganishii CBS 8797]|uniref:Actin-related protein 2/3 complex subunit 5 n=1 Tax=Huiozyma naganishii (strain ATCC MYA-139 / BCRC 22969 / CBS 8797 / KCTC 17520 / NBRC 10181 / NCYC 3082 / Yp74L-3) TaxID=1071383 RepID=J7RD18_HUIN7|nr:hypothetical protein KNAG_0L01600 [Kazachstania naganishii CBS 8797]CCK72780.1 hypothetical protein KNAG_0L01600 [Kazachstania naganishii CBS 8797]